MRRAIECFAAVVVLAFAVAGVAVGVCVALVAGLAELTRVGGQKRS
jgi:hypothetical protein